MVRHADRQHAAQSFEAGNPDGDLRCHAVRLRIDHRDGIVVRVGNKNAIGGGQYSRRTAAALAVLAERKSGPDEGLHLGSTGTGDVDHRDRIRFRDVGVAQPGNFHRSLPGFPFGAAGGPGAGETEGREGKTGGPCLREVGARYGLVLEHSEVGDVELLAVGRQGQSEGEAAHLYKFQDLAGFGVDDHHPEVGLIHRVENPALGVECESPGIAVVETLLVEVDHPPAVGIPVEKADSPGIAFRCINCMVVGKGQAHKHATPIRGVELVQHIQRPGNQLASLPTAVLIAIENGEGVSPRATIGGHHRLTRRADRQAEGSWPCKVLISKGRDDPPARQDS